MEFKVTADEMSVGIRATDKSPYIKFYLGEYCHQTAGELFKYQGNERIYNVTINFNVGGGEGSDSGYNGGEEYGSGGFGDGREPEC